MKFNNGCWLQMEGCECFSPNKAYYTTITDTAVTICAPTYRVSQRGDTLGGINLTIVITSPAKDIIRVQTYHHKGCKTKEPQFQLKLKDNIPIEVKDTKQLLRIKSGTLVLEIDKIHWMMAYKRDGEYISYSREKDLACMKTDWKGTAYDKGDLDHTYMRQQLSIGVNECIYGLGERFTPFVKNGQTVDIWNEDGGTSTEQSYKNIPFYITNKGYGVFVNHPEKVSFEVGSESVKKVEFSVAGSYLDYFFINGPTMKEVLERYTDLTGKPSLPAPWTFGLWLSTSFTTNYDEETVLEMIDGMLDRDIPLRTFHFDCFWMKEFHWSDFLWDDRVFPDPEGLLKKIKAKGLNICVWINSYIGQESALFDEGMEKGYFIKRPNGDVWQWDMWQPGMALVDFTNPEACRWFQDKLEVLLDMGVDCFKTDFGERIPTDCVYFDGSDPMKMHNYYTYLYNKTVFDLLERKRGKGEAILFARSATVGGQQFPVHWGGDCWSNYESMGESLRGGLSLMMSGFGYWSHDIGGFESKSTADVYKRWCAFGLLSSHSRLHGSTSYRVPWLYDEEAVDVVRFFTKLKAKLMPYIFLTAVNASKTGIPTMRSMVLEYTQDRTCNYIDTQYMLGDQLLVAPIFNEEGIAEYYLPKGTWTDFLTGRVLKGGQWMKEKHVYLSIPLMVRENSIIAIGARDDRPDYDYVDGVELRIFELQVGEKCGTVVYNMKQEAELDITAKNIDGKIIVNIKTEKSCSIRFVNRHYHQAKGGILKQEGSDTILIPQSSSIEITE